MAPNIDKPAQGGLVCDHVGTASQTSNSTGTLRAQHLANRFGLPISRATVIAPLVWGAIHG